MVRRRSTVRFRNGAPAERAISNVAFQDQETKFQDQETSVAMITMGGGDVAGQMGASGLRLSPASDVARLRGTDNRTHRPDGPCRPASRERIMCRARCVTGFIR